MAFEEAKKKDEDESYAAHVASLRRSAEAALLASGFDALIIHSGIPATYFSDDQEVSFRTNPAFAHWVPLSGPHHLLFIRPKEKPLLIRVTPEDYWYEHTFSNEEFWLSEFDIREAHTPGDAWKELSTKSNVAFVGDAVREASSYGVKEEALNPALIVSHLDWQRSFKTPYEISCIEEANHIAAHGHRAARDEFLSGGSELGIHYAYVDEIGVVDRELPYETITALNEKAAILHYQNKRDGEKGKVLLLDAGASHRGYASDITRTSVLEDECDFLFRGILGGMEKLQQELCAAVKPGISFPALHHLAHVKIGNLLNECGVVKLGGEEAALQGLTRAFFPHGLGHFLGIQVHDVGGDQAGPEGGVVPAPPEYPRMRMTRTIKEGNVFTIEPGLYFIESLLRPHRNGPTAKYFDWQLIDRLAPLGGIRIEDDLVATPEGSRNLTRLFLP